MRIDGYRVGIPRKEFDFILNSISKPLGFIAILMSIIIYGIGTVHPFKTPAVFFVFGFMWAVLTFFAKIDSIKELNKRNFEKHNVINIKRDIKKTIKFLIIYYVLYFASIITTFMPTMPSGIGFGFFLFFIYTGILVWYRCKVLSFAMGYERDSNNMIVNRELFKYIGEEK